MKVEFKLVHLILICLLIILIPVGLFIYNKNRKNDVDFTKIENTVVSAEKRNSEEGFKNKDFNSDVDVNELLKNNEEKTYGKIGDSKYLLFDFNDNGKLDCMIISKKSTNPEDNTANNSEENTVNPTDSANTAIDFYELSEDKSEVNKIDSIYYNVESDIGRISYALVKNNKTNENEIIIDYRAGDGICYEYLDLFKICVSKDSKITKEQLVKYYCDSELEEKLREEIRNDNTLSEEEKDTKILEAHTIIREVGDQKATEEEYNSVVNSFVNLYKLYMTDEEDHFLDDML